MISTAIEREVKMAGKLFLCATPIGNLDDMTFRVLETLKEVDLIAAEDTRNSLKLLNHFDIHTPMTSYHEYNKVDKAEYLIGLSKDSIGTQSIALELELQMLLQLAYLLQVHLQ